MNMQSSLFGVVRFGFGVFLSSASIFFAFERSSEMVREVDSSMNIGRSAVLSKLLHNLASSSSSNCALRRCFESILHSMLINLFVICCAGISSEKKRTLRPCFAIERAMFIAKPVFPMPGRPATITMSPGLRPLLIVSRRE